MLVTRLIFVALLIFGLDYGAFSQSVRATNSDLQSWNEVQVTAPITKKLSGVFSGVFRLGDHVQRPTDERIGFQFSYKANKNFTFASGFLYRATQPTSTRKAYETRLLEILTINIPVRKYNFSNRNQYEYHFVNSRRDVWWYRNRSQIDREIKIKKFKIKPFVSAEFFYNGTTKDWFRAHYTAGISKKVNKHFTLDLYYLRRQDGVAFPGNLNVFGTTWRIFF